MVGKASDFKIYEDQVHGGLIETLEQVTNAFNEASAGTIRLISNLVRGNYGYESFFKDIADLISRRDTTSEAAATKHKLAQDENISVKLNRKIGPVEQNLDSLRKLGRRGVNQQTISFLIGEMVAKGMQADQLNSTLRALVAFLTANASDLGYTVPASGTLDTDSLFAGFSKMGDRANRIGALVMHSKPYFDLVRSQIADNIFEVAGVVVKAGTPITGGKPVIVTDSDSLVVVTGTGTSAVTTYKTLGLVANAAEVEDSEEMFMHAEIVGGNENLFARVQGEFAYNIGLKGGKWDVANGGSNPTDAALGTSTNWDKVATDYKSLPGVIITSI